MSLGLFNFLCLGLGTGSNHLSNVRERLSSTNLFFQGEPQSTPTISPQVLIEKVLPHNLIQPLIRYVTTAQLGKQFPNV